MLHLADVRPATRQNIATGRLSERITGRGLTVTAATLSAQADAGPRLSIPARFLARGQGYFAFSLVPDRDMPDLSAATQVVLRAELELSASTVIAERTVAGNVLALQDNTRMIAGQSVTIRVIAGAPIDLSAQRDPAPVALQGIVLRAHDPAQPLSGVSVAVGAQQTTTNGQGRFFLPVLPLQAEIALQLTENGTTTNHTVRLDYSQPVNSTTISLPN